MRGKYSPTVTAAYAQNEHWHEEYCITVAESGELTQYDPDGFDLFGYNKYGVDRAGLFAFQYVPDDYRGQGSNIWYDDAESEWAFDGVKPVFVQPV